VALGIGIAAPPSDPRVGPDPDTPFPLVEQWEKDYYHALKTCNLPLANSLAARAHVRVKTKYGVHFRTDFTKICPKVGRCSLTLSNTGWKRLELNA